MRLFYCSDLHGAETTFRKFTNAGPFYKADIVIFGGDWSGKIVVPIVKHRSGHWTASYYGSTVRIKRQDELADLKNTLRDAGFYPLEIEEDRLDRLTPEEADAITKKLQVEVLKNWVKIADERFRRNKLPCVVIPGDSDGFHLDDVLGEFEFVQNGDGKIVEIGGYEILSLGVGCISKFGFPREISEDEITQRIDALAGQVKDMKKCIFNIHVAPYDSGLDLEVLYDEELKPILDGGELAMGSSGSKAVRAAIEKYQPALALHGHFHNSRSVTFLGRTLCINPGSDYDTGMLRGVLVEMDTWGNIVKYTLTSG